MTTGIIIGRFQVPELTIGHKALIIKTYEVFDQVAFLLGYPPLPNRDNPLTLDMRRQMLEEWGPGFVAGLPDVPGNDAAWSATLDVTVTTLCARFNVGGVTLVGGRQSFVPCYSGKYPTLEIPVWVGRSGTEVRKAVAEADPSSSSDFRKGVIWAVTNYGIK